MSGSFLFFCFKMCVSGMKWNGSRDAEELLFVLKLLKEIAKGGSKNVEMLQSTCRSANWMDMSFNIGSRMIPEWRMFERNVKELYSTY